MLYYKFEVEELVPKTSNSYFKDISIDFFAESLNQFHSKCYLESSFFHSKHFLAFQVLAGGEEGVDDPTPRLDLFKTNQQLCLKNIHPPHPLTSTTTIFVTTQQPVVVAVVVCELYLLC